MTLVAKILVGLVGLFFVVWGLRFVFTPEAMGSEFSIAPSGIPGLSTIRGDLGGAFIATGVFALLGLWRNAAHWLWAAVGVIGAIALGRLIGFAFDGTHPMTLVPFVAELIFIAVLVLGARRIAPAA